MYINAEIFDKCFKSLWEPVADTKAFGPMVLKNLRDTPENSWHIASKGPGVECLLDGLVATSVFISIIDKCRLNCCFLARHDQWLACINTDRSQKPSDTVLIRQGDEIPLISIAKKVPNQFIRVWGGRGVLRNRMKCVWHAGRGV